MAHSPPAINPKIFSRVKTREDTALEGYKTREIPVTAAGGRRAAAIATPAILSDMSFDNAKIEANPSNNAIKMYMKLESILASISGVKENSV